MSFTYAIGDIHGRIDVLTACIERIEEDRIKRGDLSGADTTIVFLGDYIDRGKNSKQVIERLMLGAQDASKWVIIKGNHEEMAEMAHHDPDQYWAWWSGHGGLATSMCYPSRKIDPEHLRWMHYLPDRYIDSHRLFVHAGIKLDTPLHQQTTSIVFWARHGRDEETPLPMQGLAAPLYIVHGHTPYMDGPVVLNTRCNVDTKSYQTGMQGIAVFDDSIAGKPVAMLTASVGYTPSW